jgi:type IV secretory pathway VirB2 component (pilin)
MNALQQLITNASTFLLGPFGVSLATLAIAYFAVEAALTGRFGRIVTAVICVAIMFSAAFIVTTWVGA